MPHPEHQPGPNAELDIRIRSLKERIYATFTGLAILSGLTAAGHTEPWEAFLSVTVGIVGISAAGFLAEVVAHQIGHERLPVGAEFRVMGRIALGALGSASAPLLLLAAAGVGLLGHGLALGLGMGVYAATLIAIFLVASRRSGLTFVRRLISSGMLVGLALLVVGVLMVGHLAQ